ncbi:MULTISPECIES: hypothetical protein [Pseudomonas syringae group]|uniref:Uncharacterized protein n=2 Tax=Pseudomonas syringae group TaxID=136849 RepID=A0A0P9KDC0_9PSED|nr:hypothetical protein [Pseudomonas caricapapayae]KAA8691275.1 hypothetical protein F4W67_25010 [Pseudomonas caricapapayae]KPW62781.1 hypothetical protein ALO80_102287 [Pseudomonas caricapapayae]RMM05541.1 hypothetical protein ALQ84_102015 [Pseudomonas caricapapayae]RMV97805.1 hypothetical protein ALP01_101508 [Pseudomonas caricapapayae]
MFILGLVVYVLGGIGLYYVTGYLRATGEIMDAMYAWIFLDAGVQISVYQFTCFGWSTVCHACWSTFFSRRGVVWVESISFSNVICLFFRVLGYLFFCLFILGIVGVGVAKRPFSDFHQFFSILIPCLLLGGWVWSARDILIAVSGGKKRGGG